MSGHRAVGRWLSCGVALIAAGCIRTTPNLALLPTPEGAGQSVRGGWVDVTVRTGSTEQRLWGEVLAISKDSVWIQSMDSSGVVVARDAIQSGTITSFRTQGSVAGWTTLGVLSTIANGWLLILTAPAWIVTGAVSHYGDVRASERDLPGDFALASIDLRTVARFPQGMPAGMDASFRRLLAPR
jgi:hypothetical protein